VTVGLTSGIREFGMMDTDRLRRLERQVRILTLGWVVTIVLGLTIGAKWQADQPESLRVRQLTIVDADGTERVWIGAPLRDPFVQGRRTERAGPVSGIVVLDGQGNERGGFVTSDKSGEVFLGLDSETAQEVLFLVNPTGGGHLSFFDSDKNLAQIGVLNKRPTLVLRERGETIFEQPRTQDQ
jgi:hypothetical protein